MEAVAAYAFFGIELCLAHRVGTSEIADDQLVVRWHGGKQYGTCTSHLVEERSGKACKPECCAENWISRQHVTTFHVRGFKAKGEDAPRESWISRQGLTDHSSISGQHVKMVRPRDREGLIPE